jgi:hypothetical protein
MAIFACGLHPYSAIVQNFIRKVHDDRLPLFVNFMSMMEKLKNCDFVTFRYFGRLAYDHKLAIVQNLDTLSIKNVVRNEAQKKYSRGHHSFDFFTHDLMTLSVEFPINHDQNSRWAPISHQHKSTQMFSDNDLAKYTAKTNRKTVTFNPILPVFVYFFCFGNEVFFTFLHFRSFSKTQQRPKVLMEIKHTKKTKI